MEEMRSFGYICPACGKAVLHSRSVFALNAAAARMAKFTKTRPNFPTA